MGSIFLKQHSRRNRQIVDPDFADAPCGSESNSLPWQAQRKAQQFCRQVQRVLNLALADRSLYVEDVSPAPDCGHLLVQVLIPAGHPVADTILALRRDTPHLRSEVAMAISRKRAPELFFVPAHPDGGTDE